MKADLSLSIIIFFFGVLLHTLAFGKITNQDPFLSSWVEHFLPVFGNLSLLDWSFPGAHQAITADLRKELPLNTQDSDPKLYDYLEKYESFLDLYDAKTFVHDQVAAQTLEIEELLNAGVRFLDFRNSYSKQNIDMAGEREDWYCLNFLLSKENSLNYLERVKKWLDVHEKEVLVIWINRSGRTAGEHYKVDPSIQQKYWKTIEALFIDIIYDSAIHGLLNETSMSDLVRGNARAIFFTSDYLNFTGGSTKAVDALHLDKVFFANFSDFPRSLKSLKEVFENGSTLMKEAKKKNHFLLASAANSQSFESAESAAIIYFFHDNLDVRTEIKRCAAKYRIPKMNEWCPVSLLEQSELFNYYFQSALENCTVNVSNRMPNALLLDFIDLNGTMPIGEEKPISRRIRYSYVFTFLFLTASHLCSQMKSQDCKELIQVLNSKRVLEPYKVWNDYHFGRQSTWPFRNDRMSELKKPYKRAGRSSDRCPPNYELAEGECYLYCPRGFKSKGKACHKNCPYGFHDKGNNCSKPSPISRGPSFIDEFTCEIRTKRTCERTGQVWFPRCGDHFSPFGCCSCRINCPPGFIDRGDTCLMEIIQRKNGLPVGCTKEEEMYKGNCYEPCENGYKVFGSACWPVCDDDDETDLCFLEGAPKEVYEMYLEAWREEFVDLTRKNLESLMNIVNSLFKK